MNKSTIVIITDSNFVLAVYILVASLKYQGVEFPVNILGIALTDEEKELLQQFENTRVIDSVIDNIGDRTSLRAIANTCKREAILSAKDDDSDFVVLLDGDCIATGDITPWLVPDKAGIYLRIRSAAEDAMIFSSRYELNDEKGKIPQRMLDIWHRDIGERKNPAIEHTSLSGNLIIHKDHLDFIDRWGDHMQKVLPMDGGNFDHVAYQMMGDFTLSSVLAFARTSPPVYEMMLDKDPDAYVAHLGPSPKFWKLWPPSKIKYVKQVFDILDWSRNKGYRLPELTWTLRKKNILRIYITTGIYALKMKLKDLFRPLYYKIRPGFKNRKQKY